MTTIKGYLVEPLTGTIRPVTLQRDNRLVEMRALIGCQLIDIVKMDDRHLIVIDDNGLADGLPCVTHLGGYASPLAGNLLIVGTTDDGETVNVAANIEDIAGRFTIVRPVLNPVFEALAGPGVFASRVAALEVHVVRQSPTVIDVQ